MKSNPEQVVDAFLHAATESHDDMVANYERHLAPGVEWHTGVMMRVGLADCIEQLRISRDAYGMEWWGGEILHQAVAGNVVFNERLDRLFRADGSVIADTHVCAIFEVEGDRIVKWRDYFNPLAFRAQLGGTG